jgi:hypothetical protein
LKLNGKITSNVAIQPTIPTSRAFVVTDNSGRPQLVVGGGDTNTLPRVGIGVNLPTAPLDVRGNLQFRPADGAVSTSAGYTFLDSNGLQGGRFFIFPNATTVGDALIENGARNAPGTWSFRAGPSASTLRTILFLDSDYNAGIGNFTSGAPPTARFHVDGDVDEEQLKVTGHTSQTANMVNIEDSGNSPLFTVDPAGNGNFSGGVGGVNGTFSGDISGVNGTLTGNLSFPTNGAGLYINNQTNGRLGTFTLVAGSSVVANTSVTGNTYVFAQRKTAAGTLGSIESYTLNAGTSFTFITNSVLDTSTFVYWLMEPLP